MKKLIITAMLMLSITASPVIAADSMSAEFVKSQAWTPEAEDVLEEDQEDPMDDDCDDMSYQGEKKLTFYCSCSTCCGKSDGITASGKIVEEGITCSSNEFPLGTLLWIEGYGLYEVQDTGNMSPGTIDIYVNGHSKALQYGVDYADIYIVDRR